MSEYLKEMNKKIIIGLADPFGSAMFNFFKNGKLKSNGTSLTEGIGQGRITKNLENIVTILCDYGTKYESKIFNKVFLKKENLPIPEWL